MPKPVQQLDGAQSPLRLYIEPQFRGEDSSGDGGIRRVVEAQLRHLPALGFEFVKKPEQADVVAVHVMPVAPTRRWLERSPSVPYVVHLHGAYWGEYEWPPWAVEANAQLIEATRQADVVTTPSEWVAQAIRRSTLREPVVLGHGVEMEDWPARRGAGGGYVLWNKTRVDPVCDPDSLVKLAELAPDVPFVTTFWPSGQPPANVQLTGRLGYEEAKEAVRQAGVYLCTTRETYGIGTLEAMAAGAPPLCWAWGAQREFVEHGVTGWLARVHDYDGLVEGLRWLLANRAKVGAAARRYAREHTWERVMAGYAEVYRAAVAATREPRPKVSVVVPAYGLEAYLPAALESVRAQTLTDWECVVVDDASPDRCGAIAEEFAASDTRFRVVHHQENQYLAGSLNSGIAASRGQYVIPLDADNLLPPQSLALLTGALDTDRSLDVAYGNVLFVTEDGRPDSGVGPGGHSGWPMLFRADWQLQERNLLPSTSMFRRRVWELTGGYRRRWRTAEDADFWTRAVSYGFRPQMVTEADTLVYRNRAESMSRVEEKPNWTSWYPWAHDGVAPAAALLEPQVPVPSFEPVLISVVIPVGPGHEELVVDAVDSVDSQMFRLWECIVVNDSCGELPRLPSWCRLIELDGAPRGVAAARNAGIAAAVGNLFLPLDADDVLEPRALARLFEVWEQFKGYVYCDWFERKAEGTSAWQTDEYDADLLISKGCLHAVTALYPVDAWRQLGGFDEALPAWEDWDFQLRLADAEICGTRVPEPLFIYRKETGRRANDNYAAFEESKAAILRKWRPYFERSKTLAGCRSCGGGGGGRAKAVTAPQQQASRPPADGEFAYVEYVSERMGSVWYRAPSGQRYRFDVTPGERVKMVRIQDVPFFARLAEFRVRQPEAPVTAG